MGTGYWNKVSQRYRVTLRSRWARGNEQSILGRLKGEKKKAPRALEKWVWEKRFRTLDCYEEMYERMCSGWPTGDLARWLQEEKKVCLDITHKTLRDSLIRFRKQIPDADLIRPLARIHREAVKRMQEGLNVLEELEKLYQIQTRRIAIDVQGEQGNQKLYKGMSGEMKEAREILIAYHRVQADLGLIKKHLGKLEVSAVPGQVAEEHGAAAGRVLAKPKKAANVLGVFNKIISLADKEADDDGVIDLDSEAEVVLTGSPDPELDQDAHDDENYYDPEADLFAQLPDGDREAG